MCLLIRLLVIVFLWRPCENFSSTPGCVLRSSNDPSYYKEGTLMIGGIVQLYLTMHDLSQSPGCDITSWRYFRHAMAMIFAVEQINKNPTLLPNITLGYQIYDSCTKPLNAVQETLCILSRQQELVPNYSCLRKKETFIGFIGDRSSETSYAMAQLIALYKYPQISFGALDPAFSDKMRFSSFYRTVPSELSQYSGIAQLLKYFGWSWVGVLTSEDDSGERALRELKKVVAQIGGCVAFSYMIPTLFTLRSTAAIEMIADKVRKSTAQVIIVSSTGTPLTKNFLYRESDSMPAKIWVASVSTSFAREDQYGDSLRIVNRSLAFSVRKGRITGFKEFLCDVSPSRFPDDDVLIELWEDTFQCAQKSQRPTSLEDFPLCTGNETLRSRDLPTYDVNNFRFSYSAYTAVYALAHAVNRLLASDSTMRADIEAGSLEKALKPWQLNRFLQKMRFETPDGEEVAFDELGDARPQYDILNWAHFKNGTSVGVPVGSFDASAPPGGQILLNQSSIIWPYEKLISHRSHEAWSPLNIPRSVCSESCHPGYHKAGKEGKPPCCYACVPCGNGEFSDKTDMESCLTCPEDQWPNERKDGCIQKEVAFLSYGDTVGLGLACTAVLFAITTAGVLGVFLRYQDTAIVKANNRDLSYALIISLILAFLCSLLFIGHPQKWTCLIQQAAFGVIFTISLSCVLTKTITVVVAFNATKPGSRLNRWLRPSVSGFMVLLFSLGQIVICLSWLLLAPPHPHTDMVSETGKIILQCDQGSATAFYAVIGYMGLLALASFVVAFPARNLPDRFNEAQYITFSMLAFCSVWVSFIPAYLSTKGRYMVAVEVFAILASSGGLLGCIFIPKCFIILFRPDMNTREPLAMRRNL